MWIEKTKSGKYKYCERVKDITGSLIKISVTLDKNTNQAKKKAEEMLRIKSLEYLRVPEKTLKFHDLINIYNNEHCTNLKISTNKLYQTKFNKIIRNSKNISISKITTRFLIEILKDISVSDNSYNNYLKLIKAIFRYAYQEDYINNIDVIQKLKYKTKKKNTSKESYYYELEEIKEIYNILKDDIFYRNVVEFLVNTGLRIGELIALTEDCLTEDTLTVKFNMDQHKNLTDTKTDNSYRKISLNSRCLEIWKSQIERNKNFKLLRKNYIDNKVIFAKKNGEFNTYSNLRKGLELILGETPKFHIYRHTHASLCFDEGIPSHFIANRLGHGGKEITEKIYIHKTQKQKSAELELFKNIRF